MRPEGGPGTRADGRTPAARLLAPVAAVLAAVLLVAGGVAVVRGAAVGAGQLAADAHRAETRRHDFEPGDIVSDARFFDADAMDVRQVQRFLAERTCVPRDDVPCLADYRSTVAGRPAEFGHCTAFAGGADLSAARIVVGVARACGISPEVLLVLLQKEQSLVTSPSASGYERATGYACPDTAPCDERYHGLAAQLWNAAWQFREYGFSRWRYHVGTVTIGYHPDPACGASRVTIEDQATADLYDYTPYQPDARALAQPDGPGGACSTYGNLNFFHVFSRWFGDPRREVAPSWLAGCLDLPGGLGCRAAWHVGDARLPARRYAAR